MGATNVQIVPATTATVTGAWFACPADKRPKFQFYLTGTAGAQTATIILEGSSDGIGIGSTLTVSLSGTSTDQYGLYTQADWPYYRARVTAISGTGATANVQMVV